MSDIDIPLRLLRNKFDKMSKSDCGGESLYQLKKLNICRYKSSKAFVGIRSEEKHATFFWICSRLFYPIPSLLQDIWDSYSHYTWLYQRYSLAFNETFYKNAILYGLATLELLDSIPVKFESIKNGFEFNFKSFEKEWLVS